MHAPLGGSLFAPVSKLQVIQSKCLHFATIKSRYTGNRQILEDLGVPLFADRNWPLAKRLGSKLDDVGNP